MGPFFVGPAPGGSLENPHLGFINLDLFKFRDVHFLHYEGFE